jgi:thiamine-phosphate pyrophosphorylase
MRMRPGEQRLLLMRIVDASANRAAEGLRTLEDLARMVLDDAELTEQLKGQRHQLTAALRSIPTAERLAARDTAGDVGTDISLASERQRQSIDTIAAAAAERTSQGLRSLEEALKGMEPQAAGEVEQLRYSVYQSAAKLQLRLADDRSVLAACRLCLLIDCRQPGTQQWESLDRFGERLIGLARAGVDLVQLRDKEADDGMLLSYAKKAVEALRPTGVPLIVNDSIAVALLSGAAGVHLGQEDLPLQEARSLAGRRLWVGISTHSLEQAVAAQEGGADYIGCGPTFPSRTKSFDHFPGLNLLRSVHSRITIPVFAIGGITLEGIEQVRGCGIDRVAVSHAVHGADDPQAAARGLAERLL